jgi:hypothetical protein
MTQDEIIDMARHIADTFGTRMCDEHGDTLGEELYAMGIDDIIETIKLVAAAEREACAKECEGWDFVSGGHDRTPQQLTENLTHTIAHHIRARGEA